MRKLIPALLAGAVALVPAACRDQAAPAAGVTAADPGNLAAGPISGPTTAAPVTRGAGAGAAVGAPTVTRNVIVPPATTVTTGPPLSVPGGLSTPSPGRPEPGARARSADPSRSELTLWEPCRAERVAAGCPAAPLSGVETAFWRPGLQQEAFEAVDPRAVGADIWYEEEETVRTAPHRFYRFYHMRGEDQQVMWESWRRTRDVFWDSPLIYYPVRYDLSWHDYPGTVSVIATWPLGEQRELLVTDGRPLAGIELPPGPPLPRTTPFADPTFPETAGPLGRDCPPVERLWSLEGMVEDPCTLAAVRTAFQYAYAAATPAQVRASVRDGHVLEETIRRIGEIANRDSFFAYWFDPANPGHYLAEVRNVRWAGRFAGASMISAEFRLYARPGLAPPGIQELSRAEMRRLVASGEDLSELALAEELPTGPPPSDVGRWDRMLVVRTADGTWRMSFPMWCFAMERKTLFESVRCPDDPNPVWSDSMWDFDLYPPNHLDFWLNASPDQRTYLGRPPS